MIGFLKLYHLGACLTLFTQVIAFKPERNNNGLFIERGFASLVKSDSQLATLQTKLDKLKVKYVFLNCGQFDFTAAEPFHWESDDIHVGSKGAKSFVSYFKSNSDIDPLLWLNMRDQQDDLLNSWEGRDVNPRYRTLENRIEYIGQTAYDMLEETGAPGVILDFEPFTSKTDTYAAIIQRIRQKIGTKFISVASPAFDWDEAGILEVAKYANQMAPMIYDSSLNSKQDFEVYVYDAVKKYQVLYNTAGICASLLPIIPEYKEYTSLHKSGVEELSSGIYALKLAMQNRYHFEGAGVFWNHNFGNDDVSEFVLEFVDVNSAHTSVIRSCSDDDIEYETTSTTETTSTASTSSPSSSPTVVDICEGPYLSHEECEGSIQYIIPRWSNDDYYKSFGIDGTRCSIQKYLFEEEQYAGQPMCPQPGAASSISGGAVRAHGRCPVWLMSIVLMAMSLCF